VGRGGHHVDDVDFARFGVSASEDANVSAWGEVGGVAAWFRCHGHGGSLKRCVCVVSEVMLWGKVDGESVSLL
jgi:hypothetical protein